MALPCRPSGLLRGDRVGVWRDDTTLQIGVDDDVLVVGPVPPVTEEILVALDTTAAPGRDGPGDRTWEHWLMARLAEHGRLAAPREVREVRLVGGGLVAARIAAALLQLGHAVRVQDPTPVAGGRLTAAERLVRHLRHAERSPTARATVDASGPADLTIVCPDTCEPSRHITDDLTRRREPYLVLRTRPGAAVVGPFVVPGETSCLRCTDLWRSDADAVWPRLAAQLSHRPAPDDPVLVNWVVGTGLAQASAFLAGEPGELRSRTLTLLGDTGRTALRGWPMHPRCSCSAGPALLGGWSMPVRMDA